MPLAIEEAYNIDKTIITDTVGSMQDNLYDKYWDIVYKDKKFKNLLLNTEIKSNSETPINSINIAKFNNTFKNRVKGIVLKYGLNREEIFENFNSIIELQKEFSNIDEYEVYLDITHSFCSMAFRSKKNISCLQ